MARDRRLSSLQHCPLLNEPGTHYTKKEVQRTPVLLRPTHISLNFVTGCLVSSPFSRETKRPLSMRPQTEVCEVNPPQLQALDTRPLLHGPEPAGRPQPLTPPTTRSSVPWFCATPCPVCGACCEGSVLPH